MRADEDDEKRLIALFDSQVIYQVTRRELTDRGILAAPVFETVKTEVNFEKDFTEEDYKHLERFGELGPQVLHRLAKNASRNALIVEQYLQKRTVYGLTIVFAADTLHAHTLAEEFQKKGVDADYVDYGRKDAQQIIERYQRDKKPDVLVNVEMLTEGFDAPHTKTVFIVRPTRSEGLLAQMVGRALRGKQSNGNEYAHLVTFLDTWQQFNVLDAEYVLHEAQYAEPLVPELQERPLFTIPLELVQEAYRLLQGNIRGLLVGVYQCVPSGWFTWEEAFENDQQRRSVMVFDNQVAGFDALLSAYSAVSTIPAEIDQELALDLIRKYFADVPDPLPRWADVKALLDAKRKGSEIHRYTFQEKAEFDPANIAKTIVSGNMTMLQEQDHIQGIWNAKAACRLVYRDDLQAFLEDISREKIAIVTPAREPALPEVEAIVPKDPPRAWASGDRGWSLSSIRDAVVSVKRHFPNGSPMVRDLKWTRHPNSSLWGFFRYVDKSVTINRILNSPDVPLLRSSS